MHQKAMGSIYGQGTCLGYRFDPQSGMYRRELIDVSLSLSLPLSLKSINMSLGED